MRKLILIFLIIFSPTLCLATDYYVRPSNPGGDGTSYANAWNGFSSINWTTVDAGNGKLFVAGTHNTLMTVGASGEAGFPIQIVSCTIANGASTDDPGIIDGNSSIIRGIYISAKSYVTIDGLIIQEMSGGDYTHACIYLENGDHITVKNCILYHPLSRGIMVDGTANFTLQSTTIDTTVTNTGNENDCLYMGTNSGGNHVIGGGPGLGNHFYQRKNGGFYIDGIQTYDVDGPMEISYNYFQDESTALTTGENMLIQIERGSGQFNIYNNIIVKGANSPDQPPVIIDTDGTAYFVHNTAVSLAGDAVQRISGTLYAKNNIFYASKAGFNPCYNHNGSPSAGYPNYNLYYHTEGPTTEVGYDTAGRTWAQWAAAHETNGVYGEPKFTNLSGRDFTLQSDSPARGGWTDKTPDITITDDYAGVTRSAYDAGAYEYEGGEGSTYNESVGLFSKGFYSQHLRGARIGISVQ